MPSLPDPTAPAHFSRASKEITAVALDRVSKHIHRPTRIVARNSTSHRLHLLLLVPTNIADIERRAVMRASWVRELSHLHGVAVKHHFLVGVPPAEPGWRVQWLTFQMEAEVAKYHDIAQVGVEDPEAYDQQSPAKFAAALRWAVARSWHSNKRRVFDLIAFTDRATYVHWPLTARMLEMRVRSPHEYLYYGRAVRLEGAGRIAPNGPTCVDGRDHAVSAQLNCSAASGSMMCAAPGLIVMSASLATWLASVPRSRFEESEGSPELSLCRLVGEFSALQERQHTPLRVALLPPKTTARAWVRGEQFSSSRYYSCHRQGCVDDNGLSFQHAPRTASCVRHAPASKT